MKVQVLNKFKKTSLRELKPQMNFLISLVFINRKDYIVDLKKRLLTIIVNRCVKKYFSRMNYNYLMCTRLSLKSLVYLEPVSHFHHLKRILNKQIKNLMVPKFLPLWD